MEKNMKKHTYTYISVCVYICAFVYIHTHKTELLCCTPETNILNQLYLNFKKKKFLLIFNEQKYKIRTESCLKYIPVKNIQEATT